MSRALLDYKQELRLIQRITQLEKIVQALQANQIQNISFGNITGILNLGTDIVFDGTGRGLITLQNGVQFTVNSSNEGRIILSSQGKVVLSSIGGTPILDSQGLVSTTAFAFNSVVGTGTQNITSTGFNALTGLDFTLNLARNRNMIIFASVVGHCTNGGVDAETVLSRIEIDGNPIGTTMPTPGVFVTAPGYVDTQASIQVPYLFPSGSHTIGVSSALTNNSDPGVIDLAQSILGYMILGN